MNRQNQQGWRALNAQFKSRQADAASGCTKRKWSHFPHFRTIELFELDPRRLSHYAPQYWRHGLNSNCPKVGVHYSTWQKIGEIGPITQSAPTPDAKRPAVLSLAALIKMKNVNKNRRIRCTRSNPSSNSRALFFGRTRRPYLNGKWSDLITRAGNPSFSFLFHFVDTDNRAHGDKTTHHVFKFTF